MGAKNCCLKQPTAHHQAQRHQHEIPENSVPPIHAAQPAEPVKEGLNFPRYSVLPSIDSSNKSSPVVCSNGDTLAQGDPSSVMNLYNRYVDPDVGFISAEGIEKLCSDLEIDPEDFRILVLAYSLGAEVMCRFTEDEFVKGCTKLKITDIKSMKESIPELLLSVKGKGFAPFYRWTYKFALDIEGGQRTLPTELAISLWKLVFTQNVPPLLDKWLLFLENNASVKGISKDTWDMFLIFVDQIKGDLTLYDDTEAWPSLLDEFVENELSQDLKKDS